MAHFAKTIVGTRKWSNIAALFVLIMGSGSAFADPMFTFNDLTDTITMNATGFTGNTVTCGMVGPEICVGTVTTPGANMATRFIQVNLYEDAALTMISDVISINAIAGQNTEAVCFESDTNENVVGPTCLNPNVMMPAKMQELANGNMVAQVMTVNPVDTVTWIVSSDVEVPEPPTGVLVFSGLVGLVAFGLRRQQRA
jgi:hypothetical protein